MRLPLPVVAGPRSTTHQRYEAKYLLSPILRELVRDHLLGYTKPDAHTARYDVTSVYYDSRSWHTFRSSLYGEKNRFKLRLRAYAAPGTAGCYAEVKSRIDRVITKQRAALRTSLVDTIGVPVAEWGDLLIRPQSDQNGPAYESFARWARKLDASPVLGVRYRREAFESAVDEPVRVTIDSDLAYLPVDGLVSGSPIWRTVHTVPAVLEIKFTDAFPVWVRRVIERFELSRVSLAKYVACVQAYASDGGLVGTTAEELSAWTA